MSIALYLVTGLVALGVLALLLLGRSRTIARGRFGRLARIGRLTTRLWTSWLGARLRRLFTSKARRARYDEARRARDAEAITRTMGEMKGAVMKLGQMMSFVGDAMPAEYQQALRSLQASAPPMDFALLREVAERELGRPLERAFASFDERPLASASIGQVHRARLPSGEAVAVKIQYPGVAEAIGNDLKNAALLYRLVAMFYPALDPAPVIDELRSRVLEELDYAHEAANQRAFHQLYADHPFIRIPRVIESHSTPRVLTSELVAGRRFDDVAVAGEPTRARFGEILFRFVYGSIVRHGVFNGDPHPGNYLYDDDGRVVFLDFGCVKHFPASMLRTWRGMVIDHLRGDPIEFRARAVELGFLAQDSPVDADRLYEYLGYFYQPIRHDAVFRYTREYNQASFAHVLQPGGSLAGIAKQLNLPRDFVLVNRIQWGVDAILAQLGAAANWHRIYREYLHDEPPATELGEQDLAYRLRRCDAAGARAISQA